MKRLQIIDSTPVSLFSNLIFKGVGRNPKTGRKKGGIKVHSVIHANEGVPCDIQFMSAAKHDHFLLSPDKLTAGDILAMDRAYIDYEKFEQMTRRGVIYVTKMKQNLTYETLSSTYYMNAKGQMQWREELVVFRKEVKVKETGEDGKERESTRTIEHKARIVTYMDEKKHKPIRLLTNDLEMPYEDIVAIYKKRWAIESLFYDKFIVMRSHSKFISDYQDVTILLLISALHNNMVVMPSFYLNVRTNGYQKAYF